MTGGPAQKQPTEFGVYLSHVASLFRPGRSARQFSTISGPPAATGDLGSWGDEQLALIIEESRRKLDQQAARFDRVRQTAQVVLPTGIALLVVVGSELVRIRTERWDFTRSALYAGWGVAMGLVLLATLGAAAILVVKATFGTVLPTLLSQIDEPAEVTRELARSYVEQTVAGEDTVNTRLTLQWWSVAFLASGGIVFSILWAVRVL
jgi:hypothetical protein